MDDQSIKQAVRTLRAGGVVALPTETTYGLACDPRKRSAVQKIFKIKGRSDKKPLQLIASSITQVKSLAELSGENAELASRYWPGPLTLLLPLRKGKRLAQEVSPKNTIGIRVTSGKIARKLVRTYGHPLAATSANRSGKSPAFSGEEVREAFSRFKNKPDIVIDAGRIPKQKPSTVVQVGDDGKVHIMRKGAIKI